MNALFLNGIKTSLLSYAIFFLLPIILFAMGGSALWLADLEDEPIANIAFLIFVNVVISSLLIFRQSEKSLKKTFSIDTLVVAILGVIISFTLFYFSISMLADIW